MVGSREMLGGLRPRIPSQGRYPPLRRPLPRRGWQVPRGVGLHLAPGGRQSRRQREVDATRGDWASPAASRITFKSYVEDNYWPTAAHLQVSTRPAYRYYLDKHFLPR
jgi:hypothetical protein